MELNLFLPDGRIGDAWQFSDGGLVHCFFLHTHTSDDLSDPEGGLVGHAVSRDMLHWQVLEPALRRGPEGSYDELDIWTGCALKHEDTFYLYYTSRCRRYQYGGGGVSLATSQDGFHWEKHPDNPLFRPDTAHYVFDSRPPALCLQGDATPPCHDFRDLCVVWDEEKQHWWGYFAIRRPADEYAETAVIGLARSYDLIHWEQLPPCFCPDKYACIETPDVFEMNGRWYMLCLTGNNYGQRAPLCDPNLQGLLTVYAVSDRPEGPYEEIFDDSILLGSMEMSGFCAKTVVHEGARYICYIQAHNIDRWPRNTSLAFPKRVEADERGRLQLRWYDGFSSLYEKTVPLTEDNALPDGAWGSVGCWSLDKGRAEAHPQSDWAVKMFSPEAEDYVIETTVSRRDARSAGVLFDLKGDSISSDNLAVLMDFAEGEIVLTRARNFPKFNARRCRPAPDSFRLKILALGRTVEIYLDDTLILHHMTERRGGKVGLFAERGGVSFTDTCIHTVRQEEKA